MKTYLFYDIETSGLNPAFDQILTFASIRTDLQFNEIQRDSFVVKLRRDIVPSPGAFLTHQLTFEELQNGIFEYEAAIKIHKIVNAPGTISIGYNTMGFDDEFLRFTFYRNLLDSYTHQYSKGCSRMDILPVTALFKVFKPDVIKWPSKSGKTSLKLEEISKINNLKTSGRAHDAMNDVEATIELAKAFSKEKKMWEYALNFYYKLQDEIRIKSIEKKFRAGKLDYRLCLMVSSSFGPDANYISPVLELGESKAYPKQYLWLQLIKEDVMGIQAGFDFSDVFIIRRRYGDNYLVLPALERFWDTVPEEKKQIVDKNLEQIINNSDYFEKLKDFHLKYKYPYIKYLDPDAGLYQDGFFSKQEKNEIALFHSTPMEKKIDIARKMSSSRVKNIALRIIFRNYQGNEQKYKNAEYEAYLAKIVSDRQEEKILGFRNDEKLNCTNAKILLHKLLQDKDNLDAQQRKIVHSLEEYFDNMKVL